MKLISVRLIQLYLAAFFCFILPFCLGSIQLWNRFDRDRSHWNKRTTWKAPTTTTMKTTTTSNSPCLAINKNFICQDGQAVCRKGRAGPQCEYDDLCEQLKPCIENAKCEMTGPKFLCTCQQDPNGHNSCYKPSEECKQNICLNGGVCMQHFHNNSHQCSCPSMFYGAKCQNRRDICVETAVIRANESFVDRPTEDIYRYYREHKLDRNDLCSGEGLCKTINETAWNCSCFEGFGDPNCSSAMPNYRSCPANLYNYPNCDVACKPKPGQFTCNDNGEKVCENGWLPPQCTEQDFCQPGASSPCISGARCRNQNGSFVCKCTLPNQNECYRRHSCPSNMYGPDCTVYCKPGPIHGCDGNGKKVCALGLMGKNCGLLDECAVLHPCISGARCVYESDEPNRFNRIPFLCQCDRNLYQSCYTKPRDPCTYAPCLNKGRCQTNSTGHSSCICKDGFFGDFCELKRDYCKDQLFEHMKPDLKEQVVTLTDFYDQLASLDPQQNFSWLLCNNTGFCESDHEKKTWKCRCFNGYQGEKSCELVPVGLSWLVIFAIFCLVQVLLGLVVFVWNKRASGSNKVIRNKFSDQARLIESDDNKL